MSTIYGGKFSDFFTLKLFGSFLYKDIQSFLQVESYVFGFFNSLVEKRENI